MEKQLKAVEEFHTTFMQENGVTPRLIDAKDSILRYNLMAEENDEYLEGCRKRFISRNC